MNTVSPAHIFSGIYNSWIDEWLDGKRSQKGVVSGLYSAIQTIASPLLNHVRAACLCVLYILPSVHKAHCLFYFQGKNDSLVDDTVLQSWLFCW